MLIQVSILFCITPMHTCDIEVKITDLDVFMFKFCVEGFKIYISFKPLVGFMHT